MKIVSWNVNGLRSVYRKGFIEWFEKENADIVCLQEIKANEDQLSFELTHPKGYYSYFNSAQKKGYAGVAVYTKKKPISVNSLLDLDTFDAEGRLLELEYREFILMNLYIPHGGRDKSKLIYKIAVYEALLKKLNNIRDKQVILAGDFNIAHHEIDLARPKGNLNNIMFTPLEREQINNLIDEGFVDSFRQFNKKGGNYTWWPYMRNARERNLGWRIDYIFISKGLLSRLKDAFVLKEVSGSDHCPVGIIIK
jgi:exodeoxyribonuclease-3